MRLLCVGMDGADYDLVRELVGAGRLPTLARIAADGAFGPLRSTVPAWTPTAWSSFLTGLNPGAHGIFGFSANPNRGSGRLENATTRAGAPLWRLLAGAGLHSAFVMIPLTYPPERVDGVIVTGFGGPLRPAILPERAERVIFSSHPRLSTAPKHDPGSDITDAKSGWLVAVEQVTDVCKLAMELVPDLSVLAVDFMSSDIAGHVAWHRLDPSHPAHDPADAGDELVEVYEAVDRSVQDLIDHAAWLYDEEPTIMVLSDHGMKPVHWLFAVNRWLQEAGLLRYRTRSLQKDGRGWFRRADARFAQVLPAYVPLADRAPLPRVRPPLSFHDIDFRRSVAYAYGYGGQVYLAEASRTADDPGAAREVEAALADVRHPVTGERAFHVVTKSRAFQGNAVRKAPDFVLVPEDERIHPIANRRREGAAFEGLDRDALRRGLWSGQHAMNGILAAAGPGFRSASLPPDAEITQVAATILAACGVGSDLDGEPIETILAGSNPTVHVSTEPIAAPVPEHYSPQEEAMIAERLRSLGYE